MENFNYNSLTEAEKEVLITAIVKGLQGTSMDAIKEQVELHLGISDINIECFPASFFEEIGKGVFNHTLWALV